MFGIPTLRPRVIVVAGLGGVAALAVIAVSVWWWVAAATVKGGIERWIEDQRAAGFIVEHQGVSASGWPFTVRVSALAPKVAGPGYDWVGDAVTAQAPLTDFSVISIVLPGEQRLDTGGVTIATDSGLTGVVRNGTKGEPARIDLAAEKATFANPAGESVAAEGLAITLTRPDQAPASHRDTGLTAEVSVRTIHPATTLPGAFSGGITGVDAQLRVQGVPPRPIRSELGAWSKDGGTIELDKFHAEWGPAKADITGTVALDNALQPLRSFVLKLRGVDEALSGLGGLMPATGLRNARLIAGMLSRPAADGHGMETQVPVSIQDRELYVGPIRVARFPALSW